MIFLNFYLRIFKYSDMIGSITAEDEDGKDTNANTGNYVIIVQNIKKHAEGILSKDDLHIIHNNDKDNKIEKLSYCCKYSNYALFLHIVMK